MRTIAKEFVGMVGLLLIGYATWLRFGTSGACLFAGLALLLWGLLPNKPGVP